VGATESGVFTLAREAGIGLTRGTAQPWLTNRGHLNPVIADAVPAATLGLLRSIYKQLGGVEAALANKRAGSSPRPDFLLLSRSLIIEVDEIQHFTTDRLAALELYPEDAGLAFDVAEYRKLISKWSPVADGYRAAKPSVDFPRAGGRRAQRAYFDAVRDLVAPSFSWRVLRVAAPECDAPIAMSRLVARLRDLERETAP
jgi:hypothetical protein